MSYRQYQSAAVEQADPVKLVEMLYDGAIRFGRQALLAIEDGDAEGAHNAIMRCYAIVAELNATLDFERGEEIARSLEQLYDYILHLLTDANMEKSAGPLKRAVELLEGLHRAWVAAFPRGLSAEARLAAAQAAPADARDGAEPQSAEPNAGAVEEGIDLVG